MAELLFRDEVYRIIGAAFEVYNEMGAGFLEHVYQECLQHELRAQAIPFLPLAKLRIRYKDKTLKKEYIADFICFGAVLVEIKALDRLSGKEESQMLNYLKATGLRVGLLINFGNPGELEWKRMIL